VRRRACRARERVAAKRPSAAADQQIAAEQQLGGETFKELKAKREIIATSPLHDSLKPLANDLARASRSRYPLPIEFYLVHEPQPNAFATPGGNVYVVDELLHFVKNNEELAGTLCHELAHTIHHDSMELAEKQKKILQRELGAAVVLGPTATHAVAIALLGKLHSLSYSRDVEERADLTGADLAKRNTMSEDEAQALARENFAIEKDKIALQDKWYGKMSKELSARTVARFFQIDQKLDAAVDVALAANIPLMH
jgi:predicted Zn-dependent protease